MTAAGRFGDAQPERPPADAPSGQPGDPARGAVILDHAGLDALIRALRTRGYETRGPTVRDGAIVLDAIGGVADLPRGVGDDQAPGRYRLTLRNDRALFGHAAGPQPWKGDLHAPRLRLWHAEGEGVGMRLVADPPDARPVALIGVRACDLAAVAIQDRVLLNGRHADPHYRARREAIFVVAVNCAAPGALCFCASMDAGPRAREGYDVALTELPGADPPPLLAEPETERGVALLAGIPSRPATGAEAAAGLAVSARCAAAMPRAMPADARDRVLADPEHPRWDDVASRCLSCANCTLVCPTCFCATVEDATDLAGGAPERWRRWDSCFTADFSHIHGGPVRPSGRARYRQWLTHKLGTWVDQFGTSGCVGCGRCVAWCPVGIDLVAEARALGEPPPARGGSGSGRSG